MAAPLHIAILVQGLSYGGAERFVINLLNAADPKRLRFSLVVFDEALPLRAELKRDITIKIVPKHGRVGWGLKNALKKVLSELKPDVVHTNLFTADIWGTAAASELGIPVVCTEHNINHEYNFFHTWLKRRMANRVNAYAVCSEAVNKFLRTHYRVERPITVIHYGIDLSLFDRLVPPAFESPFRLTIIARLVEQKGHLVALRALANLAHLPWKLRIVGGGPLLNKLALEVDRLNLIDRVKFEPFTRDVVGILGQTDIVLMPSLWEGLGIVAMEAMAAGRLLICSSVDGLKEITEPNKTAITVPPNNVTVLAQAIRQQLADPGLARHIAEQAAAQAKKAFGLDSMVDAYEALYRSVKK